MKQVYKILDTVDCAVDDVGQLVRACGNSDAHSASSHASTCHR